MSSSTSSRLVLYTCTVVGRMLILPGSLFTRNPEITGLAERVDSGRFYGIILVFECE